LIHFLWILLDSKIVYVLAPKSLCVCDGLLHGFMHDVHLTWNRRTPA
jgi:hypothetical protein